MGEMHEKFTPITAKEIAKHEAKTIRAIQARFAKAFPGETFDCNALLSPEQVDAISRNTDATVKKSLTVRKPKQHIHEEPAAVVAPPARLPEVVAPNRREWMLYALMSAATLASVQNMYRVTAELSEANMSAVLLTVVLSTSAIVFVLSGVRRWWTYALAALLIGYECMCNMTRIHAGLYTENGNATRFLGQFCHTFNSGTHESAFFLAAFTAFFIAAVQYAAVFELNRK